MQKALHELKEMRAKLQALEQAKTEPIAIIGMGCRFPGADNLQAFWELLSHGVDAISEVPPDRWDINAYFAPNSQTPGKINSRYGGFVKQLYEFDAAFFGISPREAVSLDPQQRLLLEVSWEALENAGIVPVSLQGSKTGVFVGISSNDYSQQLLTREVTEIDAYLATGNSHSTAAGRLSYTLGLTGPSIAVDTACSSSLVAVHLACQSLRNQECDTALVGGVNRLISPEFSINFSKARMLAADGRCKTFDAAADGFVRAEGCGIIILKRLADAVTDKNPILALIRGSAVNQDGRSSGLTVPNGTSQQAVISQALENSKIEPSQINYIEAHGTGTSLGDPIEINALGSVFGKYHSADNPLKIGSVKTNIGHLEAAAGIAGIIKLILSLQNQEIPPHLHFQQPNPYIPWEELPFQVTTESTPWLISNTPRFAGVSSFGFSGTNAHVVIEGRREEERRKKKSEHTTERPLHLLTLSAKTPEALSDVVNNYQEYLTNNNNINFADICFSANTGRSHFQNRLVLIAESTTQALEQLSNYQETSPPSPLLSKERGAGGGVRLFQGTTSTNKRPRIAFFFTGESSEYINIGWELYQTQPIFKQALDKCNEILKSLIDLDLLIVRGNREQGIGNREQIKNTTLFAVQYALYKLWTTWGVHPSVVIGDGIGEYVAATVAGIFSLEDAFKLVTNRIKANSINYSLPQIEVISSVSGKLIGSEIANPKYWYEKISQSVNLSKSIQIIKELDCNICVQLGAKTANLPLTGILWLPSLAEDGNNHDWQVMLSSLAQMYVNGVNIDWQGFEQDYHRNRVLLPTYPFQRQLYYVDVAPKTTRDITQRDILHSLLGEKLDLSRSNTIYFQHSLNPNNPAYLQQHQVFQKVILPGAGYIEMALAAGSILFNTDNLVLTNLEILQPLIFSDDAPTTTQVVLVPQQEEENIFEYTFEIFSLITAEDTWVVHAKGKIKKCRDVIHYVSQIHDKDGMSDISISNYYQEFQKRGIEYGESFQAITELFGSKNQALGKIQLPPELTNYGYKLHPVLLDAAFQVIGAALNWEDLTDIYLPIGLESLSFYGNVNDSFWSSVKIRPQQNPFPKLLIADVELIADNGEVIAKLEGLQLRRTNPQTVLGNNSKSESLEDWLYEIEWRIQGDIEKAFPDYFPIPSIVRDNLLPNLEKSLTQPELQTYQEFLLQLEELSIAYVLYAFNSLNWKFNPDQLFSSSELIHSLGIVPQHQQLCDRLLQMLVDSGYVQQQEEQFQVIKQPQIENPQIQYHNLLAQYPSATAELTLLHRCAMNLADVLQGKVDSLQLLFPQGDLTTATQLYQDSPGAKLMNSLVQQVVELLLKNKPENRHLRILEIGAGTGGTTAYLLPSLDGKTEYTFSDVSPLFLHKAKQKFSKYDFVEYRTLDIEKSPVNQDWELEQYDIIIAANVLHATCNLEQTLTHVRQLLSPLGQLVLLEGTQPQRWLDLIFGLTDGWWRFTDTNLRSDYPLISFYQWESVLSKCGFEEVAGFEAQPQGVVLARKTGNLINRRDAEYAEGRDGEGWLIFADSHGLGEELARQLGSDCVLVFPGEGYQELGEFRYRVNPLRKDDFERLLEGVAVEKVVHLWSLDIPTSQVTDEQLELSSQLGCASALHLVQSMDSRQSLWLVTQGAIAIANNHVSNVIQSPLWGLGKVISLEHPLSGGFCIDLDPTVPIREQASGLITEILSNNQEQQVAFREQQRYVPRLVRTQSLLSRNLLEIPENQPFELGISARGTLENLQLQPLSRRKPQGNEVEIHVIATGLNFIDVLDALGLLPFERNWFGVECAGEVVAVGDNVEDWKPGDAVIALAPSSFSQFVTTDARMVVLKPQNLSFEEAATIPANFLTAYYALNKIAKISTGKRVLIHAAAGGTGMAAVKIAQLVGAEVFATASLSKWEKLEAMGIKRQHIFNSRTLDFADEIMMVTQGEGVDIVLNSLSGDFIDKGFSVLKADGCFLEIGKRDVWSLEQVKQVKPNAQYALIDLMSLAQQQPDLIQSMLQDLMQLFETEQLQPLPRQVFSIQDVISAFRRMQQGKHIGKVVISQTSQTSPPTPLLIKERGDEAQLYRGEVVSSQENTTPLTPLLDKERGDEAQLYRGEVITCQENATYLITGGLGDLGLLFADWLIQKGAKNLVLVSRRDIDAEIQQRIQALENSGAKVMVAQVDVTDKSKLAELISNIKSLPPLRGVIHAAGVLDDGVLQHLTWERFINVLNPKMLGAWNLHILTQDLPLDFFVMFSSAASLFGSPGQGNHVAANTFLDSLAHYRQSKGMPGLSINWGVWSKIGAAAKRGVSQQMQLRGVGEISSQQGLEIFQRLLTQNSPQVGVIPVDWDKFLQQNISSPFFADFLNSKPELLKQESEFLQQLERVNIGDTPLGVGEAYRSSIVMGHLQAEVGKVLGLPSNQLPGLQQGFFDLGMDSLMTVELRNRLETSLGISIPATVIFEYPTIADLAEYLVGEVFGEREEYVFNAEERGGKRGGAQSFSVDSGEEDEVIAELAALEKLLRE
ncbi:SDR family NAD(P)-dependent oxidoreductase [Plectonema cf. radiosum LEGE 06105]|uniref:SDR family NAD(P)-dependent oxidoreductase n=2 Tax=Plectonema TaxID=1183 RepID=A0A8J7FDM6_9CYAN|nr:SDR family NAD(P)-dependent oxidoreductase [Plectonema cf. radiosum LEGE 06105]